MLLSENKYLKDNKMQEPVEQFVVFEKITIAYLHKIANEIMLLLSSNLQEKRITESQRAEKRD